MSQSVEQALEAAPGGAPAASAGALKAPQAETPRSETPTAPQAETRKLPQVKAPRADAVRNRELLVAAAAELFDERGIEAPLEEIARRAGVGIGTLYRHFPARDNLIEAVYRREVEMLCEQVPALQEAHSPEDALAVWMRAFTLYVARKRGMAMALKSVLGADSELFAQSHLRIRSSVATLVQAAVDEGSIRSDVDPADLLRAMGGICMATDSPDWAERTGRLVDLLMDGLRYGAASGRQPRTR